MQASSSAQDADAQGSGSGAQGAGSPPLRVSFYLDGAHTPESMATCADWFASATPPPAPGCSVHRVLVFNCMEVCHYSSRSARDHKPHITFSDLDDASCGQFVPMQFTGV